VLQQEDVGGAYIFFLLCFLSLDIDFCIPICA